jgi:hypothetical protein
MKKFFDYAKVGAIALVFAGLAGCSSEEDVVVNNPNYNPETGEVLTSFVMNVNTNRSPITRMNSANTQATTTDAFRGITDAHLLTFLKNVPVADGKHIINNATAANKHYTLGNVYSTGQATTDGSKSHRILELALPTETNVLMFYGKAPKTVTDGFAQGNINYLPEVTNANATDLTKYNFAVKQIVETNASGFNQTFRNYGDLLTAALNWVLASSITDYDVQYDTNGDGTVEHNMTTLSWFQFVTVAGTPASGVTVKPATKAPADGTPMCAIGEILAQTLAEICTVNNGEVRAGSGPAVARMLGDVYVIMDNCTKTAPTSLYEAKAQALASQIKANIQAILEGTAPSMNWRPYNTVKEKIGYTGDLTGVEGTGGLHALDAYPTEKFNVPAGCTQIGISDATASVEDPGNPGWVTTPGSVKFHHIGQVSLFNAGGTTTSCYNVYYPAELCYWGNSPVRVTDQAVTEAEYPQGVTPWVTEGSWTHKDWKPNAHVVSTTRSVAMQYNINYGPALLKSTVKYGAAKLYDNNHAIQLAKNTTLGPSDEPNAELTVTDGTFTLNGILIGGVATKVGWDFLPVDGSTFNNAIYDKAIFNSAIPTSGTSEPNYTLVWDNWNEAQKGNKQNPVYVCLEFVNNSGKDFWGKHNIIRAGGIFYIVGKLDPNAGFTFADDAHPTAAELEAGVDWPTAGITCLPPHDASGNTLKERRVFIQDFVTTANFVIGENSLQSAYNTVPDLRSTQISLGLNVDLQWRSGLTFDNVVLGE